MQSKHFVWPARDVREDGTTAPSQRSGDAAESRASRRAGRGAAGRGRQTERCFHSTTHMPAPGRRRCERRARPPDRDRALSRTHSPDPRNVRARRVPQTRARSHRRGRVTSSEKEMFRKCCASCAVRVAPRMSFLRQFPPRTHAHPPINK